MTEDAKKSSWWVAQAGRRLGPYSDKVLRKLIADGKLAPTDLVWKSGFDQWEKASNIPGLMTPPPLPSTPVESSARDSDVTQASSTAPIVETPALSIDTSKGETYDRQTTVPAIKESYIGRHWKGQLSLPVSYWVNTFLLNFLILLIITLLSSDDFPTGIRVQFAIVILAVSVSIAIYVWQIVGVWRCANRRIDRTQKVFWARAAQVVCVFGVVGTIGQLTSSAPTYIEMARIAFGADEFSEHSLTLLENGEELEIYGGISFGLADELSALLIANPGVKTIHLNSIGGRISEARLVRDIIESANLATYASVECLSACTIAYLGGNPRFMKEGARFGFHRYSFPGLTDDDFIAEVLTDQAYMARRGLRDDFIDKVFSKPAEDMWYPSADDLKVAGFVNVITSGDSFAVTGTPFSQTAGGDFFTDLEKLWNNSEQFRLFRLLAQNHPEIKTNFINIARQFEQDDRSWEDFLLAAQDYGNEIGVQYMPNYLATSQEPEMIAMLYLLVEILEGLTDKPGDSCYTWMFGGATKPTSLPQSDLVKMLDAIADVIETAIQNPAVVLDTASAEIYVNEALNGFIAQEGDAVVDDIVLLNTGATSLAERRRVCSVTIRLYEYLLEMDRPRGVQAIRALFSLVE